MIFNPITGKLCESKIMSSNMTQDSGIHTMSSRRDSAFSDSVLPNAFVPSNFQSRRANSDYTPTDHNPVRRLTQSMDHVTNGIQSCDIACRDLPNTCGPTNNGGDRISYHSNCHSQHYDRNSRCSNQNSFHHSGHNHNICGGVVDHYQPSDPGGNGMVLSGLNSNRCSPLNSHCADVCGALNSISRNCGSNNCSDSYKQRPISTDRANLVFGTATRSNEKLFPRSNPPTPLCSMRLQPTRHQTKNAILSILDDGEVCVEFIKKRGPLKKEMVCEIMRISPDGMRIIIYDPDGGKGVSPAASPSPLPKQGADHIYSIENLPEKHWKKYSYAVKFVDLVKAKTPKVTYYSDKAKCLLMENLTDFEVHFHEGGKVIQSSAEGIILTEASGNKFTFKRPEECSNLSGTLEFMWNHAVKSKKHCLLLEETLSRLAGSNFPIIVGRRPSSFSSRDKENSPVVTQSFAISINTTNATNEGSSALGGSRLKEKHVTVPGVGTAVQLPNGEVKVRYPDGSQLCVDGKNQVRYQSVDGQITRFSENDKIPKPIMEKLQHMPKVLKHLMSQDLSRKTHSFR
ncbi:hypothetical protein HHI36_012377 [Cryptolaemus montrouzieri]|uniref:Uncharacterized protein n=1 Tax=Cryptolaemus montrouzieri TaxID=559131 RepID=A0ABD2NES3_9CUCU